MIYKMYINGQWCLGEGSQYRDVISPATGEKLGEIPLGSAQDVNKAVLAAREAAQTLSRMSVFERAELCHRIADKIVSKREILGQLLSFEHGKPMHTEAFGEIDACVTAFRDASEQIKWMNSEMIPTRDPNKRALVYRKPRGVMGIITPWNFPLGVAIQYYLAPGLAAGNTFVWVPSPSASAIASEFMKCVEEADLPVGTINLVIGEGPVVGDALVSHKFVNAIGFTGSTRTGHIIASRAPEKPCFLELGGNGPSIVLADADLKLAAKAIARGSFSNAGQICTSTERVLVEDSVADELARLLAIEASQVRLGNPFDMTTTMGPVHTEAVAAQVMGQLEQAQKLGAKLITGGNIQQGQPTNLYIEPTIIDHVPIEASLNTDETFGPVVPLIRFKGMSELPTYIDSSSYGLSAAIFSNDLARAMLMAEELRFGIVNINEASSYWETMFPAGGSSGSDSGHGRSGGKWSIEALSETRTVVLNLLAGSKQIRE